jgi:hypothetical protein
MLCFRPWVLPAGTCTYIMWQGAIAAPGVDYLRAIDMCIPAMEVSLTSNTAALRRQFLALVA